MTVPRVLIADDNPLNVELVSYVLAADGFEVATAADATETLAQVAAFAPDLILMDIQMPGTDGLELTRRLKASPATKHIVIAAFTAYAMKGDEAKMRAAGCDGYIAKPIDVATVAATVRSYLAPRGGAT
jgi:two-component system, cell cycle response regulator DivK